MRSFDEDNNLDWLQRLRVGSEWNYHDEQVIRREGMTPPSFSLSFLFWKFTIALRNIHTCRKRWRNQTMDLQGVAEQTRPEIERELQAGSPVAAAGSKVQSFITLSTLRRWQGPKLACRSGRGHMSGYLQCCTIKIQHFWLLFEFDSGQIYYVKLQSFITLSKTQLQLQISGTSLCLSWCVCTCVCTCESTLPPFLLTHLCLLSYSRPVSLFFCYII